MTIQEAAQIALDAQDAVNLSGVVHSFSEAVAALWDEAHKLGEGTDWVNNHPIATLFLDKLNDLNCTNSRDVLQAYADIRKIAAGRAVSA